MPEVKQKTEQLQIRVTTAQKARLKAAAAAANLSVSEWVLSTLLAPDEAEFQTYLSRLARGENHRFVLAELNDFLTQLEPAAFQACVASPPNAEVTPFLANYVAAMVELAAHQKGQHPPPWTREIPPLSEPHFGATLTTLRLYLLTNSPPSFRKRNIFIDASVGEQV